MFDKTHDQMNNWMWDNPRAFGDQVDRSNPQKSSSGKVKCTGEHCTWYSSYDIRAKIEQPRCQQYKPGDFLADRPLDRDEIIDEDDDDENWVEPGSPSVGRSHPNNGNDNDNSKSEADMQGSEKATGKGKGTKDGKGNGNGEDNRGGEVEGEGKR